MSCKYCNKEINFNYAEPFKSIMKNESICFSCAFWIKSLEEFKKEPDRHIIFKGHSFYVGDENSNSSFRGFGGKKFIIKMKNGREITTTNLWSQGKINKHIPNYPEDNCLSMLCNGYDFTNWIKG